VANIDKIIKKVKKRQKLRFTELCALCEHFKMKKKRISGSHHIYKRIEAPFFTLPVQSVKGDAKPYQVKQLLDNLESNSIKFVK